MTEKPKTFIPRLEAAERAGVHPRTIDYWRRRGYLTTYTQNRVLVMIDQDELDTFLAETRVPTAQPLPGDETPAQPDVRPISREEAAKIAGVQPATIDRWLRKGMLTTRRENDGPKMVDPVELAVFLADSPGSDQKHSA